MEAINEIFFYDCKNKIIVRIKYNKCTFGYFDLSIYN